MPYRRIPILKGETYHVFNRSIARQTIFHTQRDYQRAYQIIDFYRFANPRFRYSHVRRLPIEQQLDFMIDLYQKGKQIVEIYAFTLMPNHFHFLIQELVEQGISTFMSNFQNSYAKYYNTKKQRSGGLMQAMFKSVRIETDEQLLHVGRYIHLNPITSYIIKTIEELEKYPWSSYMDYCGNRKTSFITPAFIPHHFKTISAFKKFTHDQIQYQRDLHRIEHLLHEDIS